MPAPQTAEVEKQLTELTDLIGELSGAQANGATKEDLDDIEKRMRADFDKRDAEAQKKLDDKLKEAQTGWAAMLKRPPVLTDATFDKTREPDEYEKAFVRHLRKGGAMPETVKATMATDDATTGGVLVPQNMSDEIIRLVTEVDPMADLASVRYLDQGNTDSIPRQTGNASTGWVAERGTRSQTTEPTTGMRNIPLHGLYAEPYETRWIIEDSAFDVEAFLREEVVTRLAYTEGAAFITGTGVAQPRGILPGATYDSSVGIAQVANVDHASEIRLRGMLELLDLEAAYTSGPGVAFLMRRSSMIALWDLKGGVGQHYLLPDPARAGAMNFFGYPLRFSPTMPAIAANAYPVAFGDFRQGYRIVRKRQMAFIRDEITNKGFVILYFEGRVGGDVRDPNAIQVLKIATSV